MTATEIAIGFENINLNEVDPQGKKIPLGQPVKFVINEAGVKTYENEKGAGSYIKFKFTVTDSPEFSGRDFYKTMFPDKPGSKGFTTQQLAKLMQNTGVPQVGTVEDWLTDLVAQRATFEAPLEERTDNRSGKVRTEPNLWKCEPAS